MAGDITARGGAYAVVAESLGSALHVMLLLKNLMQVLLIFNKL